MDKAIEQKLIAALDRLLQCAERDKLPNGDDIYAASCALDAARNPLRAPVAAQPMQPDAWVPRLKKDGTIIPEGSAGEEGAYELDDAFEWAPLYAAPVGAQSPAGYVLDAERYRWLRDHYVLSEVCGTDERDDFDAAVDKVMRERPPQPERKQS